MVHTDHGEYFIEPVKGHKRIPGEHHPHVVYRRTSIPPEMDIHRAHLTDNSIKAGCGVDGKSIPFFHSNPLSNFVPAIAFFMTRA